MNKKFITNKQEQGFALVVSLLLLVITTLMASLLVINAANQSKVTKDTSDKFQTFLSAETGIEDALNYIKTEAAAGRYPINGNSEPIDKICESSMTITLEEKHKFVDLPTNTKDLHAVMNLSNAGIGDWQNEYKNEKFNYIISNIGGGTTGGTGSGSDVGVGSNYSSVGAGMTYKYRIFSCGTDTNENKITVIEVVASLEL